MVGSHIIGRTVLGATLCLSLAVQGQEKAGSARGIVRDKDFQAPLAAVMVTAVETGEKVTTADQGNFVFPQLKPGTYTLVFTKAGYTRQVKSGVVVSPGKLTDLKIYMIGSFVEMEDFVVQDTLGLGAGTEASLLQLRFQSPSLLDAISSELISRSGVSNAAGALRLVAGATVKNGKSAVIRGLPDRYVSSQMNGVRLPSAGEDKRAVELDQFPATVIESIQVSKTFTPDQQGDASGGAVNVRLKSVPKEPYFLKLQISTSFNTQVDGSGKFLTYDKGGVRSWGKDGGNRRTQDDNIGSDWDGPVGVSWGDTPMNYKWSGAGGGNIGLGAGWKIGGYTSLFYERKSSFFDDGFDDSYWVEKPGEPLTPKTFQGTAQEGDFKTALLDLTRSKQLVQWGGLATVGLEGDEQQLNLTYLFTRTAEDVVTLSEDTRGKKYFFPEYDIEDRTMPGHEESDAAPYLRLETLEYTERATKTLQLNGRHTIPFGKIGILQSPELDWIIARSSAELYQPDKRQFGSTWYPGRAVGPLLIPPAHHPFKPSANFTLGNLQRIWKRIKEESDQYSLNFKLPFKQWSNDMGYVKGGLYKDQVDRTFDQDTYSNFNDNSSFDGSFSQYWSRNFPAENHPITASEYDVDYQGDQEISAWYSMLDLPITSSLRLMGGVRWENTDISITNKPEDDATWYPPGSVAPTKLNPGDGDAAFKQNDMLPSVGVEYEPFSRFTLRASYNKTVARQTFKELSPIMQQEFLGGPVFIGNSDLKMASLQNFDLRADITPWKGSLISASWFRKDIKDPIEYVQRIRAFDFTTATNYPEGRLSGYEFELRQDMGRFLAPLSGLRLGGNATFIESEVVLPEDEITAFSQPGIEAPMRKREMSHAPEHLYNFYFTYNSELTGTNIGLFYTVQGDSLVAGATESKGNFVPSIYAKEYGTLNFSLTQKLGSYTFLQVNAKNLTNPKIKEVYRSKYIGGDKTKTSYTKGMEFSISLSAKF